MIHELKRILENSNDDEAKSLLLQILLRINMLEKTDQYTEGQFVADLKKTYNDFLNYKRNETDVKNNKSYKQVHIIFGDSASGSLKGALKEMELQNEEKVISFSDIFSIGPVWQLHDKVGINNRYEWIKNHLIYDEDYIDEYQRNFNNTTSMINTIPENTKIIIWVGENSHEQTALRYVLYLLKGKNYDIILEDTTKQYKNKFYIPDADCYPLHTGEITSEKLRLIYEKGRNIPPVSLVQRKKLEEEWQELSSTQEVLRIWENKNIKNVEEAYYDDYIINKAIKVHKEQKNKDYMKSARLIGEVIGCLDQYIGDAYFEYRVRYLIMNGVFEMKGVPKAMRFYSVKLKNE
ncbi:DUF1835 domain-containing protein [Aquibacillus rhizosphaerae]|uniref:DUF1835 domain-containing protein n=1 Tax=Aquibacillus rhizosphaerae TaxID=3051431 RepID=A0ABT7L0T2_9BACI|nr:DUF1835 domain-containing protein [Aquibacillus sp. LR5S19]MDL4839441.1 DUF1835 domain-containing protein [Aquibacillus sp. LR5S19]